MSNLNLLLFCFIAAISIVELRADAEEQSPIKGFYNKILDGARKVSNDIKDVVKSNSTTSDLTEKNDGKDKEDKGKKDTHEQGNEKQPIDIERDEFFENDERYGDDLENNDVNDDFRFIGFAPPLRKSRKPENERDIIRDCISRDNYDDIFRSDNGARDVRYSRDQLPLSPDQWRRLRKHFYGDESVARDQLPLSPDEWRRLRKHFYGDESVTRDQLPLSPDEWRRLRKHFYGDAVARDQIPRSAEQRRRLSDWHYKTVNMGDSPISMKNRDAGAWYFFKT